MQNSRIIILFSLISLVLGSIAFGQEGSRFDADSDWSDLRIDRRTNWDRMNKYERDEYLRKRPRATVNFPYTYNGGVVGRLYLQPLDQQESQVQTGMRIAYRFMTESDFNSHFEDAAGRGLSAQIGEGSVNPRHINMSSNIYEVDVSFGFPTDGSARTEFGLTFRETHDFEENTMSRFLTGFHSTFGLGVTPDEQPLGANIEGRDVGLVRENGGIAELTHGYMKFQFLNEDDHGIDLAGKFSARIPTGDSPNEGFGVGLSFGASKRIWRNLALIGAASFVYQDLAKTRITQSDNLEIEEWMATGLFGISWDMGKRDGFYASGGVSYSNKLWQFKDNPGSSTEIAAGYLSVGFRPRGKTWDAQVWLSEDIVAGGKGLHDDFMVGIGIVKRF